VERFGHFDIYLFDQLLRGNDDLGGSEEGVKTGLSMVFTQVLGAKDSRVAHRTLYLVE
jgi:hypothetical protein